MNKLILICLLFVIPTAFADTCNNGDLAEELGLTATSGTSATGSGLTYCTGLNTKQICCSADTINSIQALIDTQMAQTIVQAAARDTYLLTVRNALAAVESTFTTLAKNALEAEEAINAIPTTEGQTRPASYAAFTGLLTSNPSGVNLLQAGEIADGVDFVEENWDDYQEARAKCANVLLEAQASVYCLTCRPDPATYSSFGIGGLSYDTTYKGVISAACKPYLDLAEQFNALIPYYLLIDNLSNLNTLFTTVKTTATSANSAAVTSLTGYLTVTLPTADNQEIPIVDSCASTSLCVDAYTVILRQGIQLIPAYLANGGEIEVAQSSASSRRVLAGENRALQGGAPYNPASDDNKAGVTVDFPADVIAAAANAWRQGGLMTCVVALVAMLLF